MYKSFYTTPILPIYILLKFCVRCVVDVATLTGAMMVALGTAATGVFANQTEVRIFKRHSYFYDFL